MDPIPPEPISLARAVWRVGKRVLDVGVAMVLLLAMIPLFAVIALAIKLDSPGPVFYRVRRVGYRGRPLMMLKFRKMHDDATGGPLTTGADPRLTRIGALLTKTRIDELPQFWDVLRGRMSLIGPRPEDPQFVALHADQYQHILSVRPGLTGLAQLAYAEERNILDDQNPVQDYLKRILPQKLRLDALYADRSRPSLDLQILRWTIVAILLGKPVAVSRTTGQMNLRRRPRLLVSAATHARAHALAAAGLGTIEPALGAQPLPDQTRDLAPVGPSSGLAHHEPH
jgi:lipopolysaccharide/colanic/teichoic acid biosynthesis glycosyltransferase